MLWPEALSAREERAGAHKDGVKIRRTSAAPFPLDAAVDSINAMPVSSRCTDAWP